MATAVGALSIDLSLNSAAFIRDLVERGGRFSASVGV